MKTRSCPASTLSLFTLSFGLPVRDAFHEWNGRTSLKIHGSNTYRSNPGVRARHTDLSPCALPAGCPGGGVRRRKAQLRGVRRPRGAVGESAQVPGHRQVRQGRDRARQSARISRAHLGGARRRRGAGAAFAAADARGAGRPVTRLGREVPDQPALDASNARTDPRRPGAAAARTRAADRRRIGRASCTAATCARCTAC